jgi:hypothetical protein
MLGRAFWGENLTAKCFGLVGTNRLFIHRTPRPPGKELKLQKE